MDYIEHLITICESRMLHKVTQFGPGNSMAPPLCSNNTTLTGLGFAQNISYAVKRWNEKKKEHSVIGPIVNRSRCDTEGGGSPCKCVRSIGLAVEGLG